MFNTNFLNGMQSVNPATGEIANTSLVQRQSISYSIIPLSPAITSMIFLHPSKSDVPPDARIRSNQLLNQLLENLSDLQSQFKVAHWNVKGMEFYSLHKLFGEIYSDTLLNIIDSLAERITGSDGMALGTGRDIARDTQLVEFNIGLYRAQPYLEILTTNLAYCVAQARAIARELSCNCDETTANFLQDLAARLDKVMYLLKAHLQC